MMPINDRNKGKGNKLAGLIKSTLATRLSIALIFIVMLSSVATLLVGQHWMERYNEEVAQKLNASIAMYITNEYELVNKEGDAPNLEALRRLSHQAMIINPIAEVYLLDTKGNVIAHALPDPVKADKVSLEPIKAFIKNPQILPIHGTDPRDPTRNQIFSAAEIRNQQNLQGYLYVVLGSKLHSEISNTTKDSQSRSMAVISIIMIGIIVTLTGLVIFRMLIKPLRSLSQQIQTFSCNQLRSDQKGTPTIQPASKLSSCDGISHKDEIEQLEDVFNEMSNQIEQQFKLIKETDHTRRELIANISHDLRTPLSSVQGYLETLIIKDGSLNESERTLFLKKAMNSSNRLCQLIGELFELSKLDSPSAEPNFESFSLIELAYDTLQELEIDLTNKGINYEVRTAFNNLQVYADISLIQRVFENLIRNAITYTPENGIIILDFDTTSGSAIDAIKISISDSGAGIHKQDLPYIFDRFYRDPNNSREGRNSTGLGLAIVKRILELHNSPITVESIIDKGTRFEFSLPNAT